MGSSKPPSSKPPSSKPPRPTEIEEVKSIGNYMLLKVPDFSDDFFPNLTPKKTVMTSYLRLGAHPRDTNNEQLVEPGDELLDVLPQAGPPGDPRLGENTTGVPAWDATRSAAQADTAGTRDVVFIDDVRERDPGKPGHGLDKVDRQKETAKLIKRGGWRDHSDGNRISTTYGDKVEVVRGNYKMIVMGRQEDPGECMGWDTAGSHIQDFAPGTMPGASVYQEFIEDYTFDHTAEKNDPDAKQTGVWLLVNSTENVWEYARNAGNFREEVWGDLNETYIGSENPPAGGISKNGNDGMQGHPSGDAAGTDANADNKARPPFSATSTGLVRSNPKIIERNWAREIDSWTGSDGHRVPTITEKKYAGTVNETTDISTLTEDTTVGSKTVTEKVTTLLETTTLVAGLSTEVVYTHKQDFKFGPSFCEVAVMGSSIEVAAAAFMLDVDIHFPIGKIEISGGFRFAFELGAWYEVSIGPHDDFEYPDKNGKAMKKVQACLEEQRQAITFNASVLNHKSTGVKLKMVFGKVDLGL